MPAILKKDNLQQLLASLSQAYKLVLPVRENGMTFFRPYQTGLTIDPDYINTATSPKEFLFPQTEKMLSFKYRESADISITNEEPHAEKLAVFGARSCDLAGIAALDPVFGGRFPDPQYSTRRDNVLLVGLGCRRASASCFCQAFNIDPLACAGADIAMIELEDCFAIEARTARGHAQLANFSQLLEEDHSGGVKTSLSSAREALNRSFGSLPDPAGVKDFLDRQFELPYWEQIASRCLGCGICTYICPTCHCFDIFDVTRGKPDGNRYRCWDSCMFADFTGMAGGHNPRPTQKERVRNRFMHKLKYHLDRYEIGGCVGCGRCVEKCPVNLDIRQIINDINKLQGVEVNGQ
ncbi:MAG: hypothetical protein VR67_16215 [Peptococcaceae bacterium BRH_c8a]|nr:MAG: hypothetical protein VR67_16215 [Peptococcaceae bacterium BRH_c8a]